MGCYNYPIPGAADGGASGEVEVVVQAGEDGAEDVVVQRLRRRPGAGAGAGAGASAALESRAPVPAPAAARLHAGVLLPHLTSQPVRDQGRDRGASTTTTEYRLCYTSFIPAAFESRIIGGFCLGSND